jgi:CRP-like cAMP-binding protein
LAIQPALPLFRNDILAALPPDEIRLLRPLLTRVQLVRGQSIYESGAPIGQVYFVETGLLSMSAPPDSAQARVVVDVFGRQWAAGLTVLLTPDAFSFHETIVQLPGVARRIPTSVLRDIIGRLPVLQGILLRAIDVSLVRVSQNAVCQAIHPLQQKLARWLITLHDLESNEALDVTQDMLADTLAVKRPRLATALSALEAEGLIRHSRGRVQVCDIGGLEAAACECHARLNAYGATVLHRRGRGEAETFSALDSRPSSYA